jgi:hypothetical protein
MVKNPVDFKLSYVFRITVLGRKKKPSIGGLEPICVTELNTATFSKPSADLVPSRLADL